MADLIIKPASGGALKLQEDGGTDAISIATDGKSTITNAVINAWTPPAGCLLQVVQGTHNTETGTTSTSWVATGIDVTITPSAASSKVLVTARTSAYLNIPGHVAYYTIYRGSTNLAVDNNGFANVHQTGSSSVDLITDLTMIWLDSPNTTSATTYQIYTRTNSTSMTNNWSQNGSTSVIIAQEIAG